MEATAAALLNEGLMLMRGFVTELTPLPSIARPIVWAKNYKGPLGTWATKAEGYLANSQGALSLDEQSRFRSAITMAKDVADQSPNHIDSLVYRIGLQLQGKDPAAGPTVTPMASKMPPKGLLIALGVGVLVLMLSKRR